MKKRILSIALVAAVLPIPLHYSMEHWWAFIPASVAILLIASVIHGREFAAITGVAIGSKHLLISVLAFISLALTTTAAMPFIAKANGLVVEPPELSFQVGLLFQSLNEEILFRALVLGLFAQRFGSSPLRISVIVALVFVAGHFILYRVFNPLQISLTPLALGTLFFAGFCMNYLYLAFKHIGFSWALHAGWNVAWLPASFYWEETGSKLREPELFNAILGSPLMFGVALLVSMVSFLIHRKLQIRENRGEL